MSGQDFFKAKLQPTLAPALAALAREKPKDPVTWLAEYLLAHKPPPPPQKVGTAAAMQAFPQTRPRRDTRV